MTARSLISERLYITSFKSSRLWAVADRSEFLTSQRFIFSQCQDRAELEVLKALPEPQPRSRDKQHT